MNPGESLLCLLLGLIAAIAGSSSPAQTSGYLIRETDLGSLGGTYGVAVRINDAGQVVGSSRTASGETHAFLWESGTMIDLGTLGGVSSYAAYINETGQIVGGWETASGESRAFLWENGLMIDLGTLGGTYAIAVRINDAGQVVGSSRTASGETHAFLWESGTMIDLGTLGGTSSYAEDINDAGQIVGGSTNASGQYRAFLWENGLMIDLGTLGGASSYATDINDAGQIAGTSLTATSFVGDPFLWESGSMIGLPTLGGFGNGIADINNSGQFVGVSQMANYEFRAVLWEQGTITNLGQLRVLGQTEPGPPGSSARALNDAGQIVGVSETDWESLHAFLWESGTMIDLTTSGFDNSEAFDINNAGQIVGRSTTAGSFAVMWSIITPVQIDITPGSYPNSIYAESKGKIPVAILATADYDPLDVVNGVDPATVLFAGAGKAHPNKPLGHWEDVDGDGDTDLLLHFDTQDVFANPDGLSCGDTEAVLTGFTYRGLPIEGRDFVATKCK